SVTHRLDIETLYQQSAQSLALNEIGEARVKTSRPIIVDAYRDNRITGSFILIDPANNATVGAGMVRRVSKSFEGQNTQKSGAVILVPQPELVVALEKALLASGEDVVTTHIQKPEIWRTLLRAALTVLVHAPANTQVEIVNLDETGEFAKQTLPQPGTEAILQKLEQLRKGAD
ncbi:MAG: hypothetical protein WA869_23040, partial [Alloacidobacterium sp.]